MRHQGIWVSRFGEFQGCSIFSGNSHTKLDLVCRLDTIHGGNSVCHHETLHSYGGVRSRVRMSRVTCSNDKSCHVIRGSTVESSCLYELKHGDYFESDAEQGLSLSLPRSASTSLSLSLSPSERERDISQSFFLSGCPTISLCVSLSVCLSISLFIHLANSQFIHLSILCICMCV